MKNVDICFYVEEFNFKNMKVPFSPPDMTELEVQEVREAILSGWITTGPRTKKLEQQISEYVHTQKTVCLNSATAAMEMVLHLLGVGAGSPAGLKLRCWRRWVVMPEPVTSRCPQTACTGSGAGVWLHLVGQTLPSGQS